MCGWEHNFGISFGATSSGFHQIEPQSAAAAAAAEGQLMIFYRVFLCSFIDMPRLLRHMCFHTPPPSPRVAVGGQCRARKLRHYLGFEVVTRLIFPVNGSWGTKGCNCLTFTPFFKAPSDLRASVSGWITTIGSEGETEVTGTTRTKTVRNNSRAGRRRRPPGSLKPPSPLSAFKHCFVSSRRR